MGSLTPAAAVFALTAIAVLVPAGTLEHGLEGLTMLQTLNLSQNDLGGTLPKTWEFSEMTVLNLSANHFTGSLPAGNKSTVAQR